MQSGSNIVFNLALNVGFDMISNVGFDLILNVSFNMVLNVWANFSNVLVFPSIIVFRAPENFSDVLVSVSYLFQICGPPRHPRNSRMCRVFQILIVLN